MAKQTTSTVLRTIQIHSLSALVGRLLSLAIICLLLVTAQAQQTAFTYQGRLTDGGSAASGNYDLQFALFDSPTDGTQISTTQTLASVSVSAGIFTVSLDFGANAFNGASRYLEISTRPSGAGSFTLLTPRQPIASTPYAVRSLSTATADLAINTQQLGGVAASQYVQSSDARLSDPRTPTAGSGNYIQNGSSPQSAANFNISGNGQVAGTLSGGIVNSATQFNINNTRVLSVSGAGEGVLSNTFAGVGAGTANTPSPTVSSGNYNTFFGSNAGTTNTTGALNSFFGTSAGAANTTGLSNSFFGANAGSQNTSGSFNSFFGMRAGSKNTTGANNSFFGPLAGDQNTTGSVNSFFGLYAGRANTTGTNNVFVGNSAGGNNISGSSNTFIGTCAGCAQGFGSHNSFFGENAGVSNSSEDYNTFIGANANGALGATNSTAIGAFAKVTESNTVVLGSINGVNGAMADTRVGIGTTGPVFKLQVSDSSNTGLRVQNFSAGGTVGSFGSLGDFSIDSNGLTGGRFAVKENGNVGVGTNNPLAKLDVNGKVRIQSLGSGGPIQLCLNTAAEISSCSSSRRYKTAFHSFNGGMNVVNRLQPLTFRWKADQSLDLGLGAEDVAAVEPLLVTHNANGEVEGVKYDRLSAVFINAFKEQQAQIERQQAEIERLRKLVCASRRHARACK